MNKNFSMDKLPEDARSHFDNKFKAFVDKLAPIPEIFQKSNPSHFKPPTYVPDIIKIEDIKNKDSMFFHVEDKEGNRKAVYFPGKNGYVGLGGKEYEEFESLCLQIHKKDAFVQNTSTNFIRSFAIRWLQREHFKAENSSACDYLIESRNDRVSDLEVWIPFSHTYIETPIELGAVTIQTITPEVFELLHPENINIENLANRKIRSKIQGLAAGVGKTIPQRCIKIG